MGMLSLLDMGHVKAFGEMITPRPGRALDEQG